MAVDRCPLAVVPANNQQLEELVLEHQITGVALRTEIDIALQGIRLDQRSLQMSMNIVSGKPAAENFVDSVQESFHAKRFLVGHGTSPLKFHKNIFGFVARQLFDRCNPITEFGERAERCGANVDQD